MIKTKLVPGHVYTMNVPLTLYGVLSMKCFFTLSPGEVLLVLGHEEYLDIPTNTDVAVKGSLGTIVLTRGVIATIPGTQQDSYYCKDVREVTL